MPTNSTENIYSTELENDPKPIPSSKIGYDNTESGLEATTVQGAIDELDSKIKASDEASEITYDNTESGLEAENVQNAIDELVSNKLDEDVIKNKYVLVGEEEINLPYTENDTLADLFTNAKLFDYFYNFVDSLADDEAITLEKMTINSFAGITPNGGNLYTKNTTHNTRNFSYVFAASATDIRIGGLRMASSNSRFNVVSFNDSAVGTYTAYTNDSSPVSALILVIKRYKKV